MYSTVIYFINYRKYLKKNKMLRLIIQMNDKLLYESLIQFFSIKQTNTMVCRFIVKKSIKSWYCFFRNWSERD